MIFEGWARFGGVVIADPLRTLTYLRRGLGCTDLEPVVATIDGPVSGTGYTDIYAEKYLADPFDPTHLACYCWAYDQSPYVSPSADAAPWYNVNRPESAEFLGMLIRSIDIGPVASRSVTQRATAGASIGALRLGGRPVRMEGVLLASSAAGMAFGNAWLTRQLTAPSVHNCGLVDLDVWPSCPPIGETRLRRTLANVGLVSGPDITDATIQSCCLQEFHAEFVAGSPWLLAPPVVLVNAWPISSGPVSAVLFADRALNSTARITLSAGSVGNTVTGVTIKMTPTAGACPVGDTTETILYTVTRLDRGTTLILDPARRDASIRNITSAASPVGLDAISFTGQFKWLEIPAGNKVCITVAALPGAQLNPGTTVTVERIDVEE